MVPLDALRAEALELGSEDAFVDRYSTWALLVKAPAPTGQAAAVQDAPSQGSPHAWTQKTQSWPRGSQKEAEGDAADGFPDLWIAWLRPRKAGSVMLTLGRGPATDVRIDFPSVSVLHMSLFFQEDHWQVSDQSSANGTFLNEEMLAEGAFVEAHSGDVLQIGTVILATLVSPRELYKATLAER